MKNRNATPIPAAPKAKKKSPGRPKKGNCQENKEIIKEAAIRLIRKGGAQSITVRKVCQEAHLAVGTFYYHFKDKDDLLMSFVREESFDSFSLQTPPDDPAGRTAELYMVLISKYQTFGKDFMKNFYTAWNTALAAYMGEVDGTFSPGTVMARNEKELLAAQAAGFLKKNTDIHRLAMDICTIVKGCVFEWCLSDGQMDVEASLRRILAAFFSIYCCPSPDTIPGAGDSYTV